MHPLTAKASWRTRSGPPLPYRCSVELRPDRFQWRESGVLGRGGLSELAQRLGRRKTEEFLVHVWLTEHCGRVRIVSGAVAEVDFDRQSGEAAWWAMNGLECLHYRLFSRAEPRASDD